jgi:hypothetical protein
MLLTIAPFGEFTKLFQVLLLIILPVLAFSLLATVLLHYGRKRRKKEASLDDETLHTYVAGSSPENFCYKASDGNFVYLDHTGLLREYRKKLSYSQAKYVALQQDFKKLESGFARSGPRNIIYPDHLKKITMEHTTIQQQQLVEDNINEASALNNGLKEQDYLNDLLTEKKKQIEFLQNQIDLRIKSYHYAEKEKEELRQKWEQSEQTRNKAEEELGNLQASLDEKLSRVAEVEQILQGKQDHVIYMENLVQEMKTQNQLLSAAAADAEDKSRSLREKLETEEARAMAAEQKLLANKRVLQRLYSEFTTCLQEETEEPPLIPLRPDYINNEWSERTSLEEETAAQ